MISIIPLKRLICLELIGLLIIAGATAMALAADDQTRDVVDAAIVEHRREQRLVQSKPHSFTPAEQLGICPGAGSCFIAHSNPGCNIEECCSWVCAQDPFCCENQWDGFCVADANQICASCGGNGAGSCFAPDLTPACNNAGCCNLVCAQDAFCCDTQWDNICANAAIQMCTCGGLGTGDCHTAHSTPFCNNTICCQTVCDFASICCNVEWDTFCAGLAFALCECGGSLLESCFKTHETPWCRIGPCCDEVCANDPFCCEVEWDNICTGAAYVNCCPADVASYPFGSGTVDVDDLLAVINAWGPCPAMPSENPCPADIMPIGGDGQVDVDDLLFIINQWGPCD